MGWVLPKGGGYDRGTTVPPVKVYTWVGPPMLLIFIHGRDAHATMIFIHGRDAHATN